MLPRVIKNFQVFVDSIGYLGKIPEVTLPPLKRKTEDYTAGGMSGTAELDMGLDKLELQFTIAEHNPVIKKLFGRRGVIYRFKSAELSDDDTTNAVDARDIVMIGTLTELTPDAVKRGDKLELKVKIGGVTAYTETLNSEVLIDIDILAMKEIVGGTDLLAQQRAAIGLAN